MASENSLGLKSIITTFILAGLFFVSIYSFAIGLAINYGYDETLVNDPRMNLTGIESELSNTAARTNEWIESTTSDNAFESFGEIIMISIWGTARSMITLTLGLFKVLFSGFVNVFGLPPLVIGTIGGLVIISLIFAIYRLIRQGE